MSLVFALGPGQSARLVATNGADVTLLASTSAPPGAPLELSFEGQSYRVKVRACKRTDEQPELPFRIEGPGMIEVRGVTYLFTRAFNALGSANATNVHVYHDGQTRLHCSIPCMRDCAYMIGIEHRDQILAPFYCTAPDGVHLYLAEIPLA